MDPKDIAVAEQDNQEQNTPETTDSGERPAFAVAPEVTGLRTLFVNAFFIAEEGTWVLVDTGLPGFSDQLIQHAEQRFGPGSRPVAIVLTHGHFDHVGSVQKLAQHWNVPVYAHPLEAPYLTGRSSYPPPDPSVGGGMMARMASLYPSSPIDLGERFQPLPLDGTLPGLATWRWVATPGHSPGHISLFRKADRVLLAGDAVITVNQESLTDVLRQKPEVHGPPAYFTPDWRAARQSVQMLVTLEPRVLAAGHGIPMTGETMLRDLHLLARNFELMAVPEQGRYVAEPAMTDETGVIYLPDRRGMSLAQVALAGLVVAAAVGLLLGRQRRHS